MGRSDRICPESPQSLQSRYSPSSSMYCCPSNASSLYPTQLEDNICNCVLIATDHGDQTITSRTKNSQSSNYFERTHSLHLVSVGVAFVSVAKAEKIAVYFQIGTFQSGLLVHQSLAERNGRSFSANVTGVGSGNKMLLDSVFAALPSLHLGSPL